MVGECVYFFLIRDFGDSAGRDGTCWMKRVSIVFRDFDFLKD